GEAAAPSRVRATTPPAASPIIAPPAAPIAPPVRARCCCRLKPEQPPSKATARTTIETRFSIPTSSVPAIARELLGQDAGQRYGNRGSDRRVTIFRRELGGIEADQPLAVRS